MKSISWTLKSFFAGQTITFVDDRHDYGEARFISFGFLSGRVVAIVHTATDETIRVISFRKASRNEEKIFFQEIRN